MDSPNQMSYALAPGGWAAIVPTSQEYRPCPPMVGTLPTAIGPLTVYVKTSATPLSAVPGIASSGTNDSYWWRLPRSKVGGNGTRQASIAIDRAESGGVQSWQTDR